MNEDIDIYSNEFLVEIFDFVSSGQLLKGVSDRSTEDCVIVSFTLAKEYSWDKTYGEDFLSWADIRSEKMSDIWDVIYNEEKKYSVIVDKLNTVVDDFNVTLVDQLGEQYKEILDDVISDLKGCLFSRAILGKNNEFFESIFSIYLIGGWPCGWEGEWPSGKVIYYLNCK